MVFLIDGSQAASLEFSHIRTLLERLVGSLDVGMDTTRVSVIQFSEDPRVEFLLNTHSSKDDVLSALKGLRPKGGRQVNLGGALEYVSKNIFRRPLGSRIEEGVPQFLVLISSERSSDEVDEPAFELKQSGVAPFTIARNADREELVKISLSPEYVFSVGSFRELPSLEQKLLSPITTLTTEQIQQLLAATRYPPPGKTSMPTGSEGTKYRWACCFEVASHASLGFQGNFYPFPAVSKHPVLDGHLSTLLLLPNLLAP